MESVNDNMNGLLRWHLSPEIESYVKQGLFGFSISTKVSDANSVSLNEV